MFRVMYKYYHDEYGNPTICLVNTETNEVYPLYETSKDLKENSLRVLRALERLLDELIEKKVINVIEAIDIILQFVSDFNINISLDQFARELRSFISPYLYK